MLNVLIADDEPPARERLRKLLAPLESTGRLTVVAEAGDGFEALDALKEHDVDLLFLDIRMPELDGFEVLERIPPDDRPFVVFTTAYDDYAIRAFEASAVDYLLKPLDRQRLEDAVARAERLKRTTETRQVSDERLSRLLDWMDHQADQAAPRAPAPPRDYIRQLSVPYRDRILVIPVAHLVSAEIHDGITRLYVLDDDEPSGIRPKLRQHIVSYTLDQLESNLDPDAFLRVHRSALIQVDQIREMIAWFSGRYKLVLTGDHEVIASRERSKQLKDRLMI